ncbi:GNAT family N-acetyltransferase [Saccharophagus degradans]|uniref:Histone acetyltransferase HPA2/related acetyltransferase n=1 Tax=Saccharophagus degradans (strain 2-40 / ATCC 43961 / DSM 17024) TaxID=203122 RepID=Q21MW1_SACD2|nr:GNAT family N-acetyltransferase [Saccharophagus degradans]ABD79968.1 histone acetyltransferase HPA2/related acetyltransferase [Saccharophagus degradans 2-40]
MTVIYKQASETDIEDIAPLVKALGYDFNFDVAYKTFKSLQTRGDSPVIVTSNGQIVGMAQALVDVRIAEGISGEIVSLCVLPGFRSKGIAKSLINTARAI